MEAIAVSKAKGGTRGEESGYACCGCHKSVDLGQLVYAVMGGRAADAAVEDWTLSFTGDLYHATCVPEVMKR